jgi:hypothetical protein
MAGNNGIGDFAGAFAQAFTRTSSSIQENDRRNALAKQQAKLIEMQLASGEIKLDATTTLADMMTGNRVEEFEPAPPTQTPGGPGMEPRDKPQFTNPGTTPMSVADILTDPDGQLAALQSGQLNMKQFADIQQGQQQLDQFGNFGGGGEQMFPVDANGQPSHILESVIAHPTQGVIPKYSQNPEFKSVQQERANEMNFDSLLESSLGVMSIGSELADTFSASGFPLRDQFAQLKSIVGTVGGRLGFEGSQDNLDDVTKGEIQAKTYAALTGRKIQSLLDQGVNLTNDLLEQINTEMPSIDKSDAANNHLIVGILKEELIRAEATGQKISAKTRKMVEELILADAMGTLSDRVSGVDIDLPAAASAASTAATEAAGRFSDWSMEQINSVDLDAISDEQIPQLRKRWEALKKAATPE